MKTRQAGVSRRRLATIVLLGIGIMALALVMRQIDWRESMRLLANVGPALLLVPLSQLLLVVFSTQAWRVLLLTQGEAPGFRSLYWLRLLGDVTNQLLPVAQVGGEWLRAHLLGRRGITPALAYASVLVDMSIIMLTLALLIITGIAVLWWQGGRDEAGALLAGVLVFAAIGIGSMLAQRRGIIGVLASLASRLLPIDGLAGMNGLAASIDQWLRHLYGSPRGILASAAWQSLSWTGGLLQTWMILRLLGVDASLGEALIVETVGQALRNAGGFIPGALGAMEAGYVLGCGLAGLPTAPGLALPLIRRLRDLAIGVPVLCAWQFRREQAGPDQGQAIATRVRQLT